MRNSYEGYERILANKIFARSLRTTCVLFVLLFSNAMTFAQGIGNNAAPILRINPHARQVAMGEAFTALANDYNLLRYNVGGLGILRNIKLSANFHNWIEDTQQGDLEVALPFRYGVLGVGITYFNEGDLTELNENFQPTGSIIESNDLMLSFGYGAFIKLFGQTLAFGAGTKIIRQDLANITSTGIGLDVGAVFAMKHISFGATVQNLTLSKMKFINNEEPLPESIRGGIAFRVPVGSSLKWNIAGDAAKIRGEDGFRYYAGTELNISSLLSLRGGYKFHDTEASRWGAGFGITVPMVWLARSSTDIDYAFSPIDQFDSFVHRFSFTFTFGVAQDVQPLNQTEQMTRYQQELEAELRAAREARERMDAAVRDAEARTKQLEEEMATRLERIQQIALTSAGKIEVIPDQEDSTRILVSLRIQFSFDSAVIRPSEYETMGKISEILNTYPESKLLISGHTDSIGTEEYNINLSQRRMESVMSYLIAKGPVEQNRFLWPIAYGEMRPIADNGTAAGQARNRRVDFEIITDNNDPGIPTGSAIFSVRAISDTSFAIVGNGVLEKYEVKEMGLSNRLVVDFPGIFDLSIQKNFELHRGKVLRARVGYHPQGSVTRVVFDLSDRKEYYARAINNTVVVTFK